MYEFLIANPIYAIVFVAIVTILALVIFVKVMQLVGMEKIRAEVYQLFIAAEHNFKYGENDEKFEYVICLARAAIPEPFNLFITENFIRKTVQLWFDICKDLLDDGRLNGTKEV